MFPQTFRQRDYIFNCLGARGDSGSANKNKLKESWKVQQIRKEITMKAKKKRSSKVWLFVGGAAVTATGFIVIPPLIKKYTNKVAKHNSSTENIDFDNLGPEIVRKNDDEKEEE